MAKNQLFRNETPVYIQSCVYALAHEEFTQYRASWEANIACKDAIAQAIGDNYASNCLNSKAALEQVRQEYTDERIAYVLAATITAHDWDGRVSRANVIWAKNQALVSDPDERGVDRRNDYAIQRAHIGLVDLFTTRFREEEKSKIS